MKNHSCTSCNLIIIMYYITCTCMVVVYNQTVTVILSHNTAQYSILVHTYCNSSSSRVHYTVVYCTMLCCIVLYCTLMLLILCCITCTYMVVVNNQTVTVILSHNTAQYSILVHTYCNSSSSRVLCTVLCCAVLYYTVH